MKLPVCALFLTAVVFTASPSQPALRWSGYVVNFPIVQRTNSLLAGLLGVSATQFVDVTRVRLRPSLSLWPDAFVTLEYEWNATYSSSPLLFPPSASGIRGQVIDLHWDVVRGSRWNVLHFIDRLYIRQTTDIVDVSIGRQRISWGTGRIWNPTDLFNPINPTSFAKVEKDGVDAASVRLILGSFTDVTVVVNPHRNFEGANYGIRARTNVGEYDFSVMGGAFDDRPVVGLDWAGNILDAGFRGEILVSGGGKRRAFSKFIIGFDNQFTPDLYGLVEYHYNGAGSAKKSGYDPGALIQGDILNLGRQFLALQASFLIHPLVSATAGYTVSLTDGSGYTGGVLTYAVTEDLSLAVGGQMFHGGEFDEYWYYPSSLYCRIEAYF
ncbi:MAG: hypothetical protein HRF44_09020 [Ignavibacterium sp.]